jgi:hypothetical protein
MLFDARESQSVDLIRHLNAQIAELKEDAVIYLNQYNEIQELKKVNELYYHRIKELELHEELEDAHIKKLQEGLRKPHYE